MFVIAAEARFWSECEAPQHRMASHPAETVAEKQLRCQTPFPQLLQLRHLHSSSVSSSCALKVEVTAGLCFC